MLTGCRLVDCSLASQ